MNKVKVSVILAVYNVQGYLVQCLDSLVNQTLKEIEIICVNDCSTDNSLKILEEYAQKDSRIKIINMEKNSGQGQARNRGIEIAQGEYLGFVDPDDWAELNMYEEMYKEAINFDLDIVETSRNRYREKRNKTKTNHIKNLPENQTYNIQTLTGFVFVQPMATWNKIFRRNFIKEHNILYADNKYFEDSFFSVKSRLLAKKIRYIKKAYYNYRIRAGSSISNPNFVENYLRTFDILEDILLFIKNNNFPQNIEEEFYETRIKVLATLYPKIDSNYLDYFEERVRKTLNSTDYEGYLKEKEPKKTFLEKIFSIKKRLIYCQPYKIITILGITFKIKSPIQKNKALR